MIDLGVKPFQNGMEGRVKAQKSFLHKKTLDKPRSPLIDAKMKIGGRQKAWPEEEREISGIQQDYVCICPFTRGRLNTVLTVIQDFNYAEVLALESLAQALVWLDPTYDTRSLGQVMGGHEKP
ncbi:hypothetical protein ACTXT7_011474 [Hymenolepis weldensis]